MLEKAALDTTVKTARSVEKGVEGVVKKAWSMLDAASSKERPSNYLSERGIRSIQGREGG